MAERDDLNQERRDARETQDIREDRRTNDLHPRKEDLADVEPGQAGSRGQGDRKERRE